MLLNITTTAAKEFCYAMLYTSKDRTISHTVLLLCPLLLQCLSVSSTHHTSQAYPLCYPMHRKADVWAETVHTADLGCQSRSAHADQI